MTITSTLQRDPAFQAQLVAQQKAHEAARQTLPLAGWWPCERCGDSPHPHQSVLTRNGYLCPLCRGDHAAVGAPPKQTPILLGVPARIRKARLYAGLTTMQLAERLGVTRSAVARWEAGSRVPDAAVLTAIAGACAVGAFFGEDRKIA
jgi:DNA-binding XRE family transcriptional regulator